METIRGKKLGAIAADEIAVLANAYTEVLIDLGTGDGRFVRHVASAAPMRLAIGVDACRENLRTVSRTAPPNALYVIANALELPAELWGLASHITINFPWGSLLRGLLHGDPALMHGLAGGVLSDGTLEVRLNAGALHVEGWSLEEGGNRIRHALRDAGLEPRSVMPLDRHELKGLPSTWAKRLAFGRDPRGLYLHASPSRAGAAGRPKGRAPPVSLRPGSYVWIECLTSRHGEPNQVLALARLVDARIRAGG